MNELLLPASVFPLDLALAAWLDAKSKRSNSVKTRQAYTATMASFRAALQAVGLELDGDPAAVGLVAQGWAGQGDPAPATYNQRLAIISSFFAFGRRRGLLAGENPLARVERRPVQSYATAQALSPAEVRRRLAAIDRADLLGQRDYALLSVALISGRRVGEIASLRCGNLHRDDDGRVTLTFPRAKGGKVLHDTLPLPVSRALLAYLRAFYEEDLEHLARNAPVWVSLSRQNRGQALHLNWLERLAHKRLGVHFHALRHTFARGLEDAGAKVSEIQARLGHESLATTGRYLAALRRAENPHAEQLALMFGMGDAGE